MARVVLAMSGGVDSSVAAHLLREQGHDVIGVFMRHGEQAVSACSLDGRKENSPLLPILDPGAPRKQGCCSAADADDGRQVAARLGIPFYALNLNEEFRRIVDYFVDEYTVGRTPNPCVMCNNWIKFGKLFAYADGVGADYVATGHYAQLQRNGGGPPALLRGADRSKDQSYVLFGIQQALLDRMLLPVGAYRKTEIRQRAAELGLRVALKRDSQEICFVAAGKHAQFVRQRRGTDCSGEIVTVEGQVVGRHQGIEQFTIGQRRGLAVAMGEPYFVVRIEADTRRVVIGCKSALARRSLTASRTNWLRELPSRRFQCSVQIRYNSLPKPAKVEILADQRMKVDFEPAIGGVAAGQAVVCYNGNRVLGGGWID